jgi:hypothetical protein
MNSFKTLLFGIIFISSLSFVVQAQNLDLLTLKSQIKEASLKEQKAFKEGNCEQVLELMDDDLTRFPESSTTPNYSENSYLLNPKTQFSIKKTNPFE